MTLEDLRTLISLSQLFSRWRTLQDLWYVVSSVKSGLSLTKSQIIISALEHYFSTSLLNLSLTVTKTLLVIVALVVFLGYTYFAKFYRASARELKRLGE